MSLTEYDLFEEENGFKMPGDRLRQIDVLHKKKVEQKPHTVTVVFSSGHTEEVPIENVGGKRVQLTDKINP